MLALLLLSGCGIDADSFDGWWANVDADGTVRALNFFDTTLQAAQTRDDYEIFQYALGATPVSGTDSWYAARVQYGSYAYEDGMLVWTVISPDELAGQSFANEVLSFDRDAFELESSDGGSRVYEAIEALP